MTMQTAPVDGDVGGWERRCLSELASFDKGRVVECVPDPENGTMPYIGADSFRGNFNQFTTDAAAVACETSDVLMLWDGERSGLCATGLRGAIGSTVARLRPKPGVDGRFLYHQLARHFAWIQARRTGTGVPHVPKDLGTTLVLPVPRKECEQSRIAAVLDTVDEAIAKTEAVIAKLKQVRAGLLHDLLTRGLDLSACNAQAGEHGQLRDPIAHPEQFQDSPLGRIPREWQIKDLAEMIASAVDGPFGSNLKTAHYISDHGVRVVRLQNIESGWFDDSDKAFVSEEHALSLQRHEVVPGDLLVASMGDENHPLARACLYPAHLPPGVVKADCFRIRMKPTMAVNGFIMLVLNCPSTRGEVNVLGQGVTRDRVNLTTLLTLRMLRPPVEEQKQIFEAVDALAAQIRIEESLFAKLICQKSGLMNDLLTGRVRVPEGIAEGGGQT